MPTPRVSVPEVGVAKVTSASVTYVHIACVCAICNEDVLYYSSSVRAQVHT